MPGGSSLKSFLCRCILLNVNGKRRTFCNSGLSHRILYLGHKCDLRSKLELGLSIAIIQIWVHVFHFLSTGSTGKTTMAVDVNYLKEVKKIMLRMKIR